MKFLIFCFCLFTFNLSQAQLTKYVNPFIGTGGTGHTFPGATTPFAMVQLSPDTRIDGSWEGCSGYHYNDSIIYGFSHTHLSGTGCSDYGDIAFMPWFSKTDVYESLIEKNIASKFSHKNEKASAGYYSVILDDMPVKVELTATTRTGFQRYTFNEEGYGYIVLNLKHRDELLEGSIHTKAPSIEELKEAIANKFFNPMYFSGIRRSKAWAKSQELFYGFSINISATDFSIIKEDNNDIKLILKYNVIKGSQILIKTGISTVDADAALNNLKVENPNWDFEKVKQQAQQSWEKELKKIEVQDAKLPNKTNKLIDQLTTFYTAMYHCMIHPSIMNDVDGRYKGRDGKIHKAEGFNYYTVFSLWDTHRALHPLLNIIDKKRSHDFVITFLKQFEQSGRLPMWELWNNETDCMIGFHSVSVILDAYRKDVITKAELQQLWPAVKAEAMSNRFGLDKFREKGYLSVEDESESVSKTLEYSYDMWCVGEIGFEIGIGQDAMNFFQFYSCPLQLYNNKTNFFQPKKNGNWLNPFNPYEVNNNYTEANAWQYRFYIPQSHTYDVPDFGLTDEKLLDSLFILDNKTQGRTQADITGLIGQYAHGNEPSHSYIYLLNNDNRRKYLKYVMDSFYTNKTDGLIGNEDCGQMSAWYVMSALGLYQTCPGEDRFSIGLPIFEKVKINLSNNKSVWFDKKFNEKEINDYDYTNGQTRSISFNRYDEKISLKDLLRGKNEYKVIKDELYKYRYGKNLAKPVINFIASPTISSSSSKPFFDSIEIKIDNNIYSPKKEALIKYSVNNSNFTEYLKPFFISKTAIIRASTEDTSLQYPVTSKLSTAHFFKRPHNYSIQLNCKYNRQYTADGDDGIIDGQYGDKDFRKGGWQGYQAQDFEAIIDMKEVKEFAEISANFLQDTRSWILFPTKIEFYTSDDNINYKLVQTDSNYIPANDYTVQTQKFVSFYEDRSLKIEPPTTKREIMRSARYIKVKAYNYGKLPEWHAGRGDDAFIFIDEIEIK